MKKYKLIKEYPNSPELGKEFLVGDQTLKAFSNYPEFWEEIIEKDYEILSFRSKIDKSAVRLNKPEYLFDYENWEIHSVKRLSDGEIFKVEDTVTSGNQNDNVIKSFELEKYGIRAILNRNTCKIGAKLSIINHYKQLLFTTEDGVKMYKGDEYFYVTLDLKDINRLVAHELTIHNLPTMRFSTRELAEKWLEENKPIYSRRDMLDFAKYHYDYVRAGKGLTPRFSLESWGTLTKLINNNK